MFKKKRSKFIALSMSMAFALMTAACGSPTSSEGEQLVVAQGADPVSLDPHASNDSSSALVNVQIYDTLVRQNESMEIIPGLAESFTSIDERIYEFNLREGVLFHNGDELKASDVEFTLRRALESPQVSHIVGAIDPEGIEVIDDHTIRIATKEPYAPLLSHLAHSASAILNERAVTEKGKDYGQSPVGTGPFAFSSWYAGDRVTLTRFEDYHGEAPQFDELIIRTISEATNRTVELETETVDIALDILPSDMNRVDNHDDLILVRTPNLSTSYIGFNTQKEPFNDPRVRQAINYAVDIDLIHSTILEGVGIVADGPIGSNVLGYNENLTAYEYNVQKAKELLAEAGFENGFETTIWTNDTAERVNIVTAVANQLDQIGITVNIEKLEWSTYLDYTAEGKHDMFILGWTSVTGDADYGLYSLFHSQEAGAAGNRTFFQNDRVDELLEAARSTKDQAQRNAYYAEIQEIVMTEAPNIFITNGEYLIGTQSNVRGLTVNPSGHHRFAGVYFDNAAE